MTNVKAWIAVGLLLASAAPAAAQSAPSVEDSVRKLASERHATRDAALAELARAGAPSIKPLLVAAQSQDPEVAWRAAEALAVVGQTVDSAREAEVKKALAQANRSSIAGERELAKSIIAQWPVLRHHYAATQLELLGAEIGDLAWNAPMQQHFGPGLMDFGVLEAFDVMEADVDGEDAILIEAVAELPEEPLETAEDPAAEVKKAGFGDLIKVLGRAVGRVARDDEAAGEELGEAIFERLVEEPVAVDFIGGGFIVAEPAVWHEHQRVDTLGPQSDELQAGLLRIGKDWRGGDTGLEYVRSLQGIHTVVLKDAPITDAALAQLAGLQSMSILRVENTHLSSAALIKLRLQRPAVTITAQGSAALGVAGSDHASGLIVQQVLPETGARRAGIAEQDILQRIDGLKVAGHNDVQLALYDKRPGQTVKVELLRQYKRLTVPVVLHARDGSADDAPQPSAADNPQLSEIRAVLRVGPGRVVVDP